VLSSASRSSSSLFACGACGGWKGHGNTYYQRYERGPVKHEATYRFGMPGTAGAR
jgi:hypothetical protein